VTAHRLPAGCVLLSPADVQVVVAALRFAVVTANRAAVQSGGVPGFVGPAQALLEVLADVGQVGQVGVTDVGEGGDGVHLIGSAEVAQMLGVPRRTAQRRCAAMRSARQSVGGVWLVDAAEVAALMAGRAA
jgi:hypothetical protein